MSTSSNILSITNSKGRQVSLLNDDHQQQNSSVKRRYHCTEPGCQKSFTTSGHLARHHRIHTGEKNFHCLYPGCPSKFSRQDNMMQHYRTHMSSRSRHHHYQYHYYQHRSQPYYYRQHQSQQHSHQHQPLECHYSYYGANTKSPLYSLRDQGSISRYSATAAVSTTTTSTTSTAHTPYHSSLQHSPSGVTPTVNKWMHSYLPVENSHFRQKELI